MLAAAGSSLGTGHQAGQQPPSSGLAAALPGELTGAKPGPNPKSHREWQLTEIDPCRLDFLPLNLGID